MTDLKNHGKKSGKKDGKKDAKNHDKKDGKNHACFFEWVTLADLSRIKACKCGRVETP